MRHDHNTDLVEVKKREIMAIEEAMHIAGYLRG